MILDMERWVRSYEIILHSTIINIIILYIYLLVIIIMYKTRQKR